MWKIAIIDDDRQVLQGMKKSIPWEELDAEWVGESTDGEQGLELIRTMQPHIVITDIYMPVMNGLDMIESLRTEHYDGKVIILSGYSDFEYARQALRLNVDDYLSKPITVQTLRTVLERVINQLEEHLVNKNEWEELSRKLLLYEPFVAKAGVKSVVTGTFKDNPGYSQLFSFYRERWSGSNHLVMGVEIVRTERVSKLQISDWNLFRFAVSNIIKEVINEDGKDFEFLELHSHFAAVLMHVRQGEADEMRERAIKLAERLISCVEKYVNININIGIGTLKQKWEDVSDSTEEAFEALSSKEHAAAPGLYLFEYNKAEDLQDQSNAKAARPTMRPVKFYQQLGQAIQHSQEHLANEIIQEYIGQISRLDPTASYLRLLGRELWTVFAYSLYDVGIILDEIDAGADLERELDSVDSPELLSQWLERKVKMICGNHRWNENIKHKQAVDFMVEYIHEHFAEDFTLNDLAEKVFISRNYLSHIFKKATGESFNNYLTKVRMEKAKGMILEGKYLIYEIAERVGYKNIPYFSTLFKKITGFNPTELIK